MEQTDMIQNGTVSRSNATMYEYDEYGNVVLQSSWETQVGRLVTQLWKRCSYTTIDGVTGVLTGEKVSGNGSNMNMSMFEPGDISLTVYENEPTRAVLRSISEWSTDVGDYAKTHFVYNDYGKEVRRTNVVGLVRSTTCDDVFKTFPVKVTEQGLGVSTMELVAFNETSGLEVARLEVNGLLTCYLMDGFGKTVETRARAAEPGPCTVRAAEFLSQRPYVADTSLSKALQKTYLDPQRKISFERQKSLSGVAFI
ncbi:hypothetical protein TGAM01_v205734 [Trichoderma gamsii]|uniref:Uncharacterized protein n=1 Tax=Trichoderma gamsii TaxID=398673 RepID=A0A2P4ZMD1_9HYPO|nr:hypothetical protein TGAM01_v205734 [Trichoderma gamsii]PON25440.1 hypothetical protein TGAM01_v205734 [Trichoderma gamsii]